MNIRLKDTVEHPVVFPTGTVNAVVKLNETAEDARRLSSVDIEDLGMTRQVWKIPVGAEMTLPDAAAQKLIDFGYAEAI